MRLKRGICYLATVIAIVSLLLVGFVLGIKGMMQISKYQEVKKEAHAVSLEEREKANQKLLQGMQKVSIEREIYIDVQTQRGKVRIANAPENSMLASFSIRNDSDGSMVYESNIIEPGQYIESITLQQVLREESYGCTGVWKFYDERTEKYLGEMAIKLVIIIVDRGEASEKEN